MRKEPAGVLRFELLGPVTVRANGDPAPLGPPLRRTLLALLLWNRGRTVSSERIVDALWEDDPPARPDASVQAMMSHLRRTIEPSRGPRGQAEILRTQLPGYRLVLPPDAAYDVDEFQRDLRTAREALSAGRHSIARTAATAALHGWSGTPFAGSVDVGFVRSAVEELDQQRTEAQLLRCQAAYSLGDAPAVLGELEALSRAHPYREDVWRLLVLALHAGGRTAEALQRHRTFTAVLADELGLDPSASFRDLQDAMLRQDPLLSPASAAGAADPVGPVDAAGPRDASPQPEIRGADVASSADAAPAPEPMGGAGPHAARSAEMVGREDERDVLREVVRNLGVGRSGVLLVAGPAGIGKSTLARELERYATGAGIAVGWGRCHEDVDVAALWPVLAAVNDLDESVSATVSAGGSAAVAVSATSPAAEAAPRPGIGEFPQIAAALRRRAGLQPIVLILEDLHWAGPETLRLIGFLAVELASAPVALVLTSRSDEESAALVGLLATLARQPGFRRLDLDELDVAAARTVALTAVGAEMSRTDLELVLERAGGNPFYIAETARLVAAGDRGGLPGGVRAVVQRRLQSLSERARTVLLAAAVLGVRFDLGLLASMTSPTGTGADAPTTALLSEELLEALQEGIDRAVLAEIPGSAESLGFSHAVVRDAVLDGAGVLTRRRRHARAAAALQARGSDETEAVAHHLLEGLPVSDRSAAVAAAVAAARASARALAHDTAAHWFDRALAALPTGTAGERGTRLDLLVERSRSLSLAGALEDLHPCLLEAFDLAIELDRPAALGPLTEILDLSGGVWFWVDFGTVPTALLERLGRASRLVAGERNPAGPAALAVAARLCGTEAVGRFYESLDLSRELAARAVRWAEESGDVAALAAALGQQARVLWQPDHHEEQIAVADRLLDLLRTAPSDVDADAWSLGGLIALGARSTALGVLGRFEAAEEDCRRALEMAQGVRLGAAVTQLRWQQVGMALGRGDIAGAAELSKLALEQQERTQLYQRESLSLMSGSEIARMRGQLGFWGDVLAAIGDRRGLPTGWLSVESALQRGDVEGARRIADSLDDTVEWPGWAGWLACVCIQARACADLGDTDRCERLAAALRPHSGRHGVWGSMLWLGPVDHYLGRLEIVLGNLDSARTLLRSAVGQARSAGLVPAAAQAAEALSRILPVGAGSAAERRDLLAAVAAWQQELQLAGG